MMLILNCVPHQNMPWAADNVCNHWGNSSCEHSIGQFSCSEQLLADGERGGHTQAEWKQN